MVELSYEFLKEIRRIQISSKKNVKDSLSGSYHSAFKGRGMEFEDVREYQVGDDVRHIDWNVTARMNTPYVKSFREERELTVLLLVDISASSLFGSLEKNKKQVIVEIAALLTCSAIDNNDKVGLLLFSDNVELYLPPKKGAKYSLRILRELLNFKPKGVKTDYSKVLSFLANVQKKQGICFFISDFLSPISKKEVTLIAKRHDLIGVSVLDPKELVLPKKGVYKLRDLESDESIVIDLGKRKVRDRYEKKMINRKEEIVHLFKRIGADFIHFKSGDSYVNVIYRFFKSRRGKAC
jgi:uncharacterized protein (DUF58 family)